MEGDGDTCASEQMSKKKQRMAQLIQKSMGMMQHGGAQSEHEASLSTRQQQPSQYGRWSETRGDLPLRQTDTKRRVPVGAANGEAVAGEEENGQLTARKQYWTEDEDAKLCALVQQHGPSQWAKIAAYFPNRDRKRCRERFVNHLDPQLKRCDEWKQQEDEHLMRLQKQLGNHWVQIAQRMPGRSPEDVKNHFLSIAAHNMASRAAATGSTESASRARRAVPHRWTKADSTALRALVEAHGASNWLFIASQLLGRTDLQCMQHWYQVLDPSIVKGKGTWTADEDLTLQTKVAELGHKWTEVRSATANPFAPLGCCEHSSDTDAYVCVHHPDFSVSSRTSWEAMSGAIPEPPRSLPAQGTQRQLPDSAPACGYLLISNKF